MKSPRKLILAATLTSLLLTGCSAQQVRHSITVGLTLADWKQTRYIASHPQNYYEMNPIIGKHPSRTRVDTYFMSAIIIRESIHAMLPNKYLPYWDALWIGVSGSMVVNNAKIGIKLSF